LRLEVCPLSLSVLEDTNCIAAEDKNSKLMSSEGMEATEEEIQESFGDEEDDSGMEVDESQGISLDG
jgi:hypothetical protein